MLYWLKSWNFQVYGSNSVSLDNIAFLRVQCSCNPSIKEESECTKLQEAESSTCIWCLKLILSERTSCILDSLIHRSEASQDSNTQHSSWWRLTYAKQQKQEKLGQGSIYSLKNVMFTCISAISVSQLQLMQLIKSVLKTLKIDQVTRQQQQQKGLQT